VAGLHEARDHLASNHISAFTIAQRIYENPVDISQLLSGLAIRD
jgi:hypothetical protein